MRAQLTQEIRRTWTLPEVAQRFRVTTHCVRAWISKGRFPRPRTRIGRKLVWTDEEISDVIAGKAVSL